MKTRLFFSAFLFMTAVTLSSCKDNYTCVCTYMEGSDSKVTSEVYTDVTMKDATDACDAKQSDLLNAGKTSVDCNLN